jgi:two-component system, OmpR family, response regulator
MTEFVKNMDNSTYRWPVLVIDDDEDLCHILEMAIVKSCEVHCEHTLATAKAYLTAGEPGIIFLDNNLPDGLGVASISGILRGHPDTKIVLMTSEVSEGICEQALNLGAARFIAKPFKVSAINQIIRSLVPELPRD